MRILAVSDTHGDLYSLRCAVRQQPKAEIVLHMGDGERELAELKMEFTDRMIVGVRGNCDWGSASPDTQELILEGKKIFLTHGHLYQAKMGLSTIIGTARDRKAHILLFGHTHTPYQAYEEGLYILNPGSLSGADASYGIVDITPAGIVTALRVLR